MRPDDPIFNAYEAIREGSCFDAFTAVPHPENLKFHAQEEHSTLLRLGTNLSEIVNDAEGEDLQHAAHAIKCHFWIELGLPQAPERSSELPRFLLKPNHRMQPRIDAQKLARQLASIPPQKPPALCIVSSKLALLKPLLNLSDATIKFLRLAYANSRIHSLTTDETSGLPLALSHISVFNTTHRNRAVSALIEESIAAVERLFSPPSIVLALRFVDATAFARMRNLRDVFSLTDDFISLLETPYRSHSALLAAILEPEQDFDLLNDETIPLDYLYEIFPESIAECYERAVLDQPLHVQHIGRIVEWFTGGLVLSPGACGELDGRLGFEVTREAIKRTALACCQTNAQFDGYAVLKALYAVAE